MALITITRGPWVINDALLVGNPARISDTLWTVQTSVPAAYALTADECYQLGYSAGDLGEGGEPEDLPGGIVLDPLATIQYASDDYTGANSFQPVAIDLNLDADAGSSDDPKYIGPIMGNVLGAALTKTKSYIAALIGKYSITGARQSTYPQAAVIAEVGDGVTTADGAFVAVLGGDSEVTQARAAYTADNQNSTALSAFEYFMDATNGEAAGHDGYGAMEYSKAFARLGFNAGGESIILAFGVATDDAGIVAQVGADNLIADGSLYISALGGAGTFWQKVNDVWTQIS